MKWKASSHLDLSVGIQLLHDTDLLTRLSRVTIHKGICVLGGSQLCIQFLQREQVSAETFSTHQPDRLDAPEKLIDRPIADR
jgi:hypothetical protein